MARVYANTSDAEFLAAARWKLYAAPYAPERTCAQPLPQELLDDILVLSAALARAASPLANASRALYLSLHAFHSTGLEGNTLTLPETLLTVQGQPLLAGLAPPSGQGLPAAMRSAQEALSTAQLWHALHLAELPAAGRSGAPPHLLAAPLTLAGLVHLNSATTRGSDTPVGLRTHGVGVGQQRTLLPLPDEVPVLVREFLAWLAEGVAALAPPAGGAAAAAAAPAAGQVAQLQAALALACNAHTRFVYVHPFSDGNGRTARTLAALVLQRSGLPAPMLVRHQRSPYMAAVSRATMARDYAPLALLHAQAVRRSLACLAQLALAAGEGSAESGAGARLQAASARGGCELTGRPS